MAVADEQAGGATTQQQPSEEQIRAYEAELNRITSSEMILQTAVSLINIGGRHLGLDPSGASDIAQRDLEQVRDAIDAVSALLPILERRMPGELAPLRNAIAQLQVAYAREAQNAGDATVPAAQKPTEQPPKNTEPPKQQPENEQPKEPGPAQASGRLWVPGR